MAEPDKLLYQCARAPTKRFNEQQSFRDRQICAVSMRGSKRGRGARLEMLKMLQRDIIIRASIAKGSCRLKFDLVGLGVEAMRLRRPLATQAHASVSIGMYSNDLRPYQRQCLPKPNNHERCTFQVHLTHLP